MSRVLLDECVPVGLRRLLTGHDVVTAGFLGWAGKQDRAVLALASAEFDVLVTADRSLIHQQNMRSWSLGIVILPTNKAPRMPSLAHAIGEAIALAREGRFVIVQSDGSLQTNVPEVPP